MLRLLLLKVGWLRLRCTRWHNKNLFVGPLKCVHTIWPFLSVSLANCQLASVFGLAKKKTHNRSINKHQMTFVLRVCVYIFFLRSFLRSLRIFVLISISLGSWLLATLEEDRHPLWLTDRQTDWTDSFSPARDWWQFPVTFFAGLRFLLRKLSGINQQQVFFCLLCGQVFMI